MLRASEPFYIFSLVDLLFDSSVRPSGSAAYVLKRDSATDITITQMFIALAIMLEVY